MSPHSAHFSQRAPIFHGRHVPVDGTIVGYAAIIHAKQFDTPLPHPIALISAKNQSQVRDDWHIFPNRYLPEDHADISELEALYRHLVFALKYEAVDLRVLSVIAKHYTRHQLTTLTEIEPTGQYSRRIWFLLEWILGEELPGKVDISKKSYVKALDPKQQFDVPGVKSARHMVINNLPGNRAFCPLIKKTDKLIVAIQTIRQQPNLHETAISKDVLQRASAFMMLKDSKASFTIEGESPKNKRATRWAHVIGQAGKNKLSKQELVRLQQVVIEDNRFVEMGLRKKGGFVGEHDRVSGTPIPEHISAKWTDLESLIDGLIGCAHLLEENKMDPVLAATIIAFGFVFIHPFEDGNGRIHRYLIHHMLAITGFSEQGIVFPISASILDKINDYRLALESYSHPLLDHIEWEETENHNIKVTNETKDFYRFFDATVQAEFLYECVKDTIDRILPDEITYLTRFDAFKKYMAEQFDIPDKGIALLVRFLTQNHGVLSRRARDKEFSQLRNGEVQEIESKYQEIFDIQY